MNANKNSSTEVFLFSFFGQIEHFYRKTYHWQMKKNSFLCIRKIIKENMINNKFKTDTTFINIAKKFTVYHDERIAIIDHLKKKDTMPVSSIKADAVLIILCEKGDVTFFLNNKFYTATTNDLIICQPQTIFQKDHASADFECYGFCLSPEFAKQLFLVSSNNWKGRLFFENNPIIKTGEEGKNIFQQYYELLKSKLMAEPHPHQKELINALLQAFIYEMYDVSDRIKKEPNNFNSSTNLFNSFLQLIVSTYPKERSVAFYAEKLFVTSKYLTAVCKNLSGKTALAIITQYVIQDIEYLLRCPEKSIKQIANEQNFPNLSFFGKYVKRCLGVSPKEYRERVLKNSLL